MGRFLGGLIIGLFAFPLLGVAYLMSGRVPVGVTDRSFPLEQYVAGAAVEARIHQVAPKRDLANFSAADLMAGAQTYRRGCGCHGLPGETSNGPEPKMYPPPPRLFTPDGSVTDDPVGVTYWKINHGIRMTGMPSFQGVLTDDQMWQVAALLARADKLPPDVMDALKQPPWSPSANSAASTQPHPKR
jgi:thiosulfate dehydrogenase